MVTLGDDALDRAAERLAEYRSKDSLADILEQYATLIESYKRLKSDYEEEREGRERYKQLARGHERNPFALVIVDGDGYVFDESLILEGEEGGIRAAKQLNDTIKASLRRKGLEGCEVVVRVYANLVGLSKHLNKNGLCGAEKRSLAPFIAGFNRFHGLTDFVDAGELKENADHKIKAMLRLYADNAQCKHIYFAACHDVGYVADLTPYRGNTELFTLIRTSSQRFHDEFNKLSMNTEELPGVFRATALMPYPVAGQVQNPKSASLATRNTSGNISGSSSSELPINAALHSISAKNSTNNNNNNNNSMQCTFYAAGKCKYGSGCKFLHLDTKQHQKSGYNGQSPSHMTDSWRTGNKSNDQINYDSYPQNAFKDISVLPRHIDIPTGFVAINANGDRLDPYVPAPSSNTLKRFKAISGHIKLCNKKHLSDSCYDENCEYDHTPIPGNLKPVLELMARTMPCPQRGGCRKPNCIYGHVCQKADCRRRGGKAPCRFPFNMCCGDFEMNDIVPATMPVGTNGEDAHSTGSGGFPVEESEDGVSILDAAFEHLEAVQPTRLEKGTTPGSY
ncbi:hypothetical protein EDB81DRAFT_834566 [Dactylonectria macrodidyma]|uniref:C3H1-type domain-containing protein n=1 Tax=Dactylonectria macrodidyma TaxID=307937 RepID=A0A9P9CX06_9HYPO|nr:hypothetical protein EDB81DRAFT_834566 [Dactylonectria macrodidyma]